MVTDGVVKGVNFAESERPRRQDWPGELVENGMFYFATADLVKDHRLQGGRSVVVLIGEVCKQLLSVSLELLKYHVSLIVYFIQK